MSQVLPSDNLSLLDWGNVHAPVLVSNAAGVGLTSAQAQAFDASNKAMQGAWLAFNDAKAALREASNAWQDARGDFRQLAAQDVALIKNFASRSANPAAVYALAQIPMPSPPTPGVAPSAPEQLRAVLETQTGVLTVRWGATQPKGVTGVVYSIQRAIGSGPTFTTVGVTGGKAFEDSNLPAGTARVQYRVFAQRGSLVSAFSPVLDVRFTTNAQGVVELRSSVAA